MPAATFVPTKQELASFMPKEGWGESPSLPAGPGKGLDWGDWCGEEGLGTIDQIHPGHQLGLH